MADPRRRGGLGVGASPHSIRLSGRTIASVRQSTSMGGVAVRWARRTNSPSADRIDHADAEQRPRLGAYDDLEPTVLIAIWVHASE